TERDSLLQHVAVRAREIMRHFLIVQNSAFPWCVIMPDEPLCRGFLRRAIFRDQLAGEFLLLRLPGSDDVIGRRAWGRPGRREPGVALCAVQAEGETGGEGRRRAFARDT